MLPHQSLFLFYILILKRPFHRKRHRSKQLKERDRSGSFRACRRAASSSNRGNPYPQADWQRPARLAAYSRHSFQTWVCLLSFGSPRIIVLSRAGNKSIYHQALFSLRKNSCLFLCISSMWLADSPSRPIAVRGLPFLLPGAENCGILAFVDPVPARGAGEMRSLLEKTLFFYMRLPLSALAVLFRRGRAAFRRQGRADERIGKPHAARVSRAARRHGGRRL